MLMYSLSLSLSHCYRTHKTETW